MFKCNTAEGIISFLYSFAGLYKLTQLRERAFVSGEALTPWIVMGHFFLDIRGKCWEVSKNRFFNEEMATLPRVTDKIPASISYSLASVIPRSTIMCPYCNQKISLNDYPAVVKEEARETVLDFSAYAGLPLASMEAILEARTDGKYQMWTQTLIRQKNSEKWVSKDKNYIIQHGDECGLHCLRYYHGECSTQIKAEQSRKQFYEIFEKAGYKNIKLEEIPNQYCPCEHCEPWQTVITSNGDFVIGWRKRVISIEWAGRKYSELFVDEDVTKWDTGIHAWGRDKAVEYLKKVLIRTKEMANGE